MSTISESLPKEALPDDGRQLQLSPETVTKNGVASGVRPVDLAIRFAVGLVVCVPIAGAKMLPVGFVQTLCDRLAAPALLAIFCLTVTGAGWRLASRVVTGSGREVERVCLAFTLGWAISGLELVVLASLRLFVPWVILVNAVLAFSVLGLGAGGVGSGWDAWSTIPWARMKRLVAMNRRLLAPIGLTTVLCLFAFFWAAGPVWDWDSEMYHLPGAQFLIDSRGLAVSYGDPLLNVPGQVYLWYGIGLAAGQANFASLLMWLATVVTSIFAACLAARCISLSIGLWTPLIYWSGAIVTAVAITPRLEPYYSLMFLAAVAVLQPVVFFKSKSTVELTWTVATVAGLCLGSAAAAKYHGLIGWVVIGGWMACVPLWCRDLRTWNYFGKTVYLFVVALAVLSPWCVKNFVAWGNPFYPVLTRASQTDVTRMQTFEPTGQTGPLSLLTTTGRIFVTPNAFNGAPSHFPHYMFLLLPLLFIVRPSRVVISLAILSAAYYWLSMSLSGSTRYLLPIVSLLSIACAYVVVRCERFLNARTLFTGIVAFSTAFVLFLPARLMATPHLVSYLAGRSDEEAFLANITGSGFHRIVEWINNNTPQDATVMMCWDARQFRIHRHVIIDPGYGTWNAMFRNRADKPAEALEALRKTRVNYILINEGALRFNVLQSGRISEEAFQLFVKERELLVGPVLQPVSTIGQITVYKVGDGRDG